MKNQGDIQQGLRNNDRTTGVFIHREMTILTGNWLSAMIDDQGQLSAMNSDEYQQDCGKCSS